MKKVKKSFIPIILILLYLLPIVYSSTNINSCSVLNTANEVYYLTADIINSGATKCMDITADNVTLNCQGHTIDGVGSGGTYGIHTNSKLKPTIYNCKVTDWQMGTYLWASSNVTIINGTYSGNTGWDLGIGDSNHDLFKNISIGYKMICAGTWGFSYFENITGTVDCKHYSISHHFGNNTFKYIKGILKVDGRNTTIIDSNLTELNHGNEGNLPSLITRVKVDGTLSLGGNLYFYDNIYVSPTDCTHPECVWNTIGYPNATWNTTKTLGTNIIGGSYMGGNYWTSSTGHGWSDVYCVDRDFDYICDNPLPLAPIGHYDYHPLVKNIPPTTTTTILQAHPPDITFNPSCSNVSYPNTLSLSRVSSALLKNSTIDWYPHYVTYPTTCSCYNTTYFRFSESRDNYYLNNNTHIYKYDKNWNLVGTIVIDNAETYDGSYFYLFRNVMPCNEPSCDNIARYSDFTKFVHTDDNYHWAVRVGYGGGSDSAVIWQKYYGSGNTWSPVAGNWYFYYTNPPITQDSVSVKSFYDEGDVYTLPYKDRHFWNYYYLQTHFSGSASILQTFNRSTNLGILRGSQRVNVSSTMARNSTHFFHLWDNELTVYDYSLDSFMSSGYMGCCPPASPIYLANYKVKNYNNQPIQYHSGITCVHDNECYIASPFTVSGENGILVMKFDSSNLNVSGSTLYANEEQFIPNCYLNLNNDSVQEIWLTNHGNNMEMIFAQDNNVYHLETGRPTGFYCGELGICTANPMCFFTSVLEFILGMIVCIQGVYWILLLGGIGLAVLLGLKAFSRL